MSERRSPSAEAALWASALRLEDVPAAVRADAKLRVLDILGVSLVARDTDAARAARAAALRLGSGTESRIWGFGDRSSAASAALANGTQAHTHDYDDTHNESVVHVSAPIVTAALTLGEALDADGATVLTAAVAGAEMTCRIGVVANRDGIMHKRGYHPTGVCGTLGAAFTAGRLLGLDADRMRHAVGNAGSFASGLMECFIDGTWSKRMHPGWAAHGGIAAAYLGAAGFTGPAGVIDGPKGLVASHIGGEGHDFASIAAGLGEHWSSPRSSFKPYPCGHVVHAFLDAVIALHKEGLRAEQVVRIECPTAPWMLPIMCEPRDVKLHPESDYHAKFSFYYCIAAALRGGRLGVDAFTDAAIADPETLALAARIVCTPDHTAPGTDRFKGWVRVETTDGRRLERIVDDNWGSPANPMTAEDVRRKFRDNASLVLPSDRVDAIEDAVDRLERLDRIATLVDLTIA